MARDYAKKSGTKRKPIAGWIWLVSGLIIGLFIAFLGVLAGHEPGGIDKIPPSPAKLWKERRGEDKARLGKEQPPAKEKTPSTYDFYTLLPKYEVAVPQEEVTPPRTAEPPARRPAETPGNAEAEAQTETGRFILQAGSFRTSKDADTRRAQLALLGIIASVQTVDIKDGETWHRVRVGPIQAGEELDRMRRLLGENGIEYLLVREKL